MPATPRLRELDFAHIWHPFTQMRDWRRREPCIIERAEGFTLIDTEGRRYIDGFSSLWCNVHGHRVPEIDDAIRRQLDKVAHATMLGHATVPAIELAARLIAAADNAFASCDPALSAGPLRKVFFSDSGATAVEVALKMAVGRHFHRGEPQRDTFVTLAGAYHGDTFGAMSVGWLDAFHRPYERLRFRTMTAPAPHVSCAAFPLPPSPAVSAGEGRGEGFSSSPAPPRSAYPTPDSLPASSAPPHLQTSKPHTLDDWPSLDSTRRRLVRDHALAALSRALDNVGDRCAGLIIEPVMMGAAGMIAQPEGYLAGAARLARERSALLIADAVATGFGRTGTMFACESEGVRPDILCLAKGITGGYLPLAATLCTDEIAESFEGEPHEGRALQHGHTYTGNPLACAAAIASLDLFGRNNVLASVARAGERMAVRLREGLAHHPHVGDVRIRGVMCGIELVASRAPWTPFEPGRGPGAAVCRAARDRGLLIRPLGDVVVLMPAPAMDAPTLDRMLDIVVETIAAFDFSGFPAPKRAPAQVH